MSHGAPWVKTKVVYPNSSARGNQRSENLKAGNSHQFLFDDRQFFLDVFAVNPDSGKVDLAVRRFDRPRIGTPADTAEHKGNWEDRRLDVPGAYYALDNLALVKLSPLKEQCQVQIEFATSRQAVTKRIKSSGDRLLFRIQRNSV